MPATAAFRYLPRFCRRAPRKLPRGGKIRHRVQGLFQDVVPATGRVEQGQANSPQFPRAEPLDNGHLLVRQERPVHGEGIRARFVRIHDVRHVADHDRRGSDDIFPQGVDRRIRHLGKVLLEIVIEHLGLLRQNRQGAVHAHGADRFLARPGHGEQDPAQVFLGVPKGLLGL